ncbi:MAG: insulinase family protein [Candidatus Bathyarchaeota archaeon]|nr:insulinase family protein [Candidatus Termiticorpusculum sp.]
MSNSLVWYRNVLPNGLRVLYLPKLSANTVQLSVAVEYGSNREVNTEAGAAHFLEHMLAGGSEERIQKSRSVEGYGGSLNFYTDHEYTMSFADVLPESLPQTAGVLSELLFDNLFEEEKFVSEREIILQELAEDLDDPAVVINELLLKNLFKKHPVNRPIGGYAKTLNRLNMHHLKTIHSTAYEPQNMILLLMGNLSNNQIQEVLKHFKDKPNKQKLNAKCSHPQKTVKQSKKSKKIARCKQGITQTYINIGTQTVDAKNTDAPTLDLISMILSGGASSRLFIELREKRALTYDVATIHRKGLDFGYLNIGCAVKTANVDKTQKLILDELFKLREEKVLEEELERNKKLMLRGILRGIDSPDDCQDIVAYMEIQFNHEKALTDYIDKIKNVTTTDIFNAAQTYLQEDKLTTAILKPKK